ncbi:MAG: fused MFS/spermidine synthase [Acidobacteriota bacterium]|nr:fused MFS/spermidine synthase [Acidobacteriota bacterium]
MRWLFLLAYACSGLAGLIYEVSWTRLLTLYIGHTTAAASAVVAAFLGGLALGAGAGGAIASRLSPRRSLQIYIALELAVAVLALLLPIELSALKPLLRWAYGDGAPGLLFPAVRVLSCLVMVFVPALALGATFPMAIRWYARDAAEPARQSSALYFVNTVGAAVGSLLAGFVLIPALGIAGTTRVGIAASVVAALLVWIVLGRGQMPGSGPPSLANTHASFGEVAPKRPSAAKAELRAPGSDKASRGRQPNSGARQSLAIAVLGLSGFAALMHEIAWTRILSLVLGPTTYAFAATLAAVITGVAVGSGLGTWIVGRTRHPSAWLSFTLAAAALTATWTYSLAGARIPLLVATEVASASNLFDQLLRQGSLLTVALILPTAACLGAAFPFALAMVGSSLSAVASAEAEPAERFGMVYAVNTIGAVSGSLAAGFFFIPRFGLQPTLTVVSGCLIAAALVVIACGPLSRNARVAGILAAAAAGAMIVFSPPWDRALLASGVYMYAPYVPKDLDLSTLLKAGTLLYYREGAAATVSVKRLTGTTTLAVDGKVDASNRSDMLTQKMVAHLPLLLHDNPREVMIVGLGSGATVGSALRHPITRADVLEISPEVVAASQFFVAENYHALEDPRTNLIVGDGRSHLLLTNRTYDVIISEPSNPWIAGVAALFTREFFSGARDRLAAGGIMCQWANAYNISDADLRSIAATFKSVFPNGSVWLVGGDDVLFVGSEAPIEARLANIERNWNRPGVAGDLAKVSVLDTFSILSLYMGGPAELDSYSQGARTFSDDRMTLEFSAPRELHRRSGGENAATLGTLLGKEGGPEVVRQVRATAGAVEWRHRAQMMAKADVHGAAYDDYVRALTIDPADRDTLEGFVKTAMVSRRSADALAWIKSLAAARPPSADVSVAVSKLLASIESRPDALAAAHEATLVMPLQPAALEQLASLHADAGDTVQLDAVVARLRQAAPNRPGTEFYAAVAAFLHGREAEAVELAQRAIAIDPAFAPVYDLIGAAYTKLDRPAEARQAFEKSLSFDAHDSTAYTNLGLLELAAGNRARAAQYFAEALWLAPESQTARQGLSQSQ